MQETFAIVLFVVVAVAAVAAVWALATSGGSYDQIGRGGIEPPRDAQLTYADLREEVRTLVEAQNARRVARGEAPLDVEAEVERRLHEL
jgi:hypothetical protein